MCRLSVKVGTRPGSGGPSPRLVVAVLSTEAIPSYSRRERRRGGDAMAAREIPADEVGLPRFAFSPSRDVDVFDLDSHARAREALDFGLAVPGVGFYIFVFGEDRTGWMTA